MEINFRMLSLARETRGLTQSQLVDKVENLTQGNYSRMEKGLLPIPSDTLNNLSQILNYPLSFFMNNKFMNKSVEYFYRKRLTMPKKIQIRMEANFDVLRIWIETLLNEVELPEFLISQIEVEGNNSPEEIARKSRFLLGLDRGPIDKLISIVEKNGIVVYPLKDAPAKFDGTTIVTFTGQIVVILNDNMPNYRKRFTLAHELGHIIMHLPFSPIVDSYRDVETEANRFASEFLMPEFDIRRDLAGITYGGLSVVKSYWMVSKAAIIHRAFDLKYISNSKYTSMMIELSRQGERRAENLDVYLDSPQIIKQTIDVYKNHLNYTDEEIIEILSISSEDFKQLFLESDATNIRKIRVL